MPRAARSTPRAPAPDPIPAVTPAGPFLVRSRAQLRALVSPARQEIVDALVAAGPCSIADLAAHTGRAPDSLYFHVRRLITVGLVLERDARSTGRRPASVYDVPGRPISITYPALSGLSELPAVVSSALRLADRDFSRAFAAGTAVLEGSARTLWGGRAKGWAGPREVEEINRLIARLLEIVHSGRPGEGRAPLSLTFVLAPVRTGRRARRAPAPRPARPRKEEP